MKDKFNLYLSEYMEDEEKNEVVKPQSVTIERPLSDPNWETLSNPGKGAEKR